MKPFEKKCDCCEEELNRQPVNRYFSTSFRKERVASYFGALIDETSDEVYWSDFY